MTSINWGVFDAETTGLLKDNPRLLVAAVWKSATNSTHLFTAETIHELASALERLDAVVTWNGRGYDNFVLNHGIGRLPKFKNHIDLWRWIADQRPPFEKGWKLEDVAFRLWGTTKSHLSAEISGFWALGEQITVAQHALDDVYLTRSVFEHIRDERWIPCPQGERMRVEVPNSWKQLVTRSSNVPNVNVPCL